MGSRYPEPLFSKLEAAVLQISGVIQEPGPFEVLRCLVSTQGSSVILHIQPPNFALEGKTLQAYTLGSQIVKSTNVAQAHIPPFLLQLFLWNDPVLSILSHPALLKCKNRYDTPLKRTTKYQSKLGKKAGSLR